jgi:hypothetical protein
MSITGLTVGEFEKAIKRGEDNRCYLCKRKFNEKGVMISVKGDELTESHYELKPELIELSGKGATIKFLLCHECMFLLKILFERFESEKDSSDGLFEIKRERINR